MTGGPASRPAVPAFGPGFFGKLPARGDFVARGLPVGFLNPWEDWLHGLWQVSWTHFGDVWPTLVSQGPVWRFALEAGLCGADPVAGLMAPSCDRLGRVFPLCVAAGVAGRSDPAALPITAGSWYGRAEALLRRGLDPTCDVDDFERNLQALGPPGRVPAAPALPKGSPGWHIGLDPAQAPALSYSALVHDLAVTLPERFSLWWTLGAHRVGPSMVVCDGLPGPDAITAFFDGAWDYWGWADADAVYPEED